MTLWNITYTPKMSLWTNYWSSFRTSDA